MGFTPWHMREPFLEEEISDLKKCLAGDSTSKRFQALQLELRNKEDGLSAQRELNRKYTPSAMREDKATAPFWWEWKAIP